MFPALGVVMRKCTKDWPLPGSDLVVKKGERVAINAIGAQNHKTLPTGQE